MNNKGFTLIELLATITILAIITSIGVVSSIKISNAIRLKQRENVIKRIEIAASNYAHDTGKTLVFVDTLVKEGYIDSDDDVGFVIDPVTKESLNCYAVEMEKAASYYNAYFQDNDKYDNSGLCDLDALYIDYAKITLSVIKNNLTIDNTKTWLKGDFKIVATSETLQIDCNNNNCLWSNTNGLEENGTNEKIVSYDDSEFETVYSFTYKTNNTGVEKFYSEKIRLKIDNLAPRIENVLLNEDNTATITLLETGSGLAKICINSNSSSFNCNWEDINNNTFVTNVLNQNTNYYIHIKDKVGNERSEIISTGS